MDVNVRNYHSNKEIGMGQRRDVPLWWPHQIKLTKYLYTQKAY